MTVKNLEKFDKFIEMAVTAALKEQTPYQDRFNKVCGSLSESFGLLRKSGFSFGTEFIRSFDTLFIAQRQAVVVDVSACLWMRCKIPGPPEGRMGWGAMHRGDLVSQVASQVVSDDDMLRTGHEVGPLSLGYPVLAVYGDCSEDFGWLTVERS